MLGAKIPKDPFQRLKVGTLRMNGALHIGFGASAELSFDHSFMDSFHRGFSQ
ncbi:MAG: hypothetical protein PHP75_04810 [Methylacidiphilaceae bacterium]|nr:hypothetical protein [Candidatus Methylacidiphilaceae bacterium]